MAERMRSCSGVKQGCVARRIVLVTAEYSLYLVASEPLCKCNGPSRIAGLLKDSGRVDQRFWGNMSYRLWTSWLLGYRRGPFGCSS
jgi:hypothetical protein